MEIALFLVFRFLKFSFLFADLKQNLELFS